MGPNGMAMHSKHIKCEFAGRRPNGKTWKMNAFGLFAFQNVCLPRRTKSASSMKFSIGFFFFPAAMKHRNSWNRYHEFPRYFLAASFFPINFFLCVTFLPFIKIYGGHWAGCLPITNESIGRNTVPNVSQCTRIFDLVRLLQINDRHIHIHTQVIYLYNRVSNLMNRK